MGCLEGESFSGGEKSISRNSVAEENLTIKTTEEENGAV